MSIAKNKIDVQSSSKIVTKRFELITTRHMPSIISKDAVIEGKITSNNLIEIEGEINGDLFAKTVVIRESGSFKGNIKAENLNIKGSFDGIISAKQLSISQTAKVTGQISYASLSVEDGACIDATFKKDD
jgi:cytoskeletal protein CcmA (bactofilin family)